MEFFPVFFFTYSITLFSFFSCFKSSCDVLVIDLGHLKITSDPEQERIVSTKVLVEVS